MFATVLAVMCKDMGKLMKYRQLINHHDPAVREVWVKSSANEFGRLFQGVGGQIKSPNNAKDVQYGKFECTE